MSYNSVLNQIKKYKLNGSMPIRSFSGHTRNIIKQNMISKQLQVYYENRCEDGTYTRSMHWETTKDIQI